VTTRLAAVAGQRAPAALCAPALLCIPGTDAVVLEELMRLEAALEVLATTPPPAQAPSRDNARLG